MIDLTILPPNLKDIRQFFMTEPDFTPPAAAARPHVVASPNGDRSAVLLAADDARENGSAGVSQAENAIASSACSWQLVEDALYR
jgi:hypothetical protein